MSNRNSQNIFNCRRGLLHGNRCAFMKYAIDSMSGELAELGCSICRKDEYRIYPEHNTDGTFVHNKTSWTDPFPVGVDVIWENLSPHDTGLTYSYDRRDIRPEEYNFHPLYTIKDINEPLVTGTIGDEHAAYAFGKDFPAISSVAWTIQEVKGLQRMEPCMVGLYAQFNERENMVFPKCLKDYSSDIIDWKNYTTVNTANPAFPRKKFFISEEPISSIAKYCVGWFENTKTAAAIFEILLAMKDGEFVDLKKALHANGVHAQTSKKFRMEVSTMSKRTLYRGNMNLHNIYLYYHALEQLNIPEAKVRIYRANIINFLMNYPGIANIDLNSPPAQRISREGRPILPVDKRYWYLIMILRSETLRAEKGNKKKGVMHKPLINYSSIPKWVIEQVKSMTTSDKHGFFGDDLKNPAVVNIKTMLGIETNSKEKLRRLRVFSRLLEAGRRWNQTEIHLAWYHFNKAYDAKNPQKFWRMIESVRTANPAGIDNYLKELERNTGMFGDLSDKRAFATHLLEERKHPDSFEVERAPLCDRWCRMYPKPGRASLGPDDEVRMDRAEVFWLELKKIHVKDGRYKFQIFSDILKSSSEKDYDDLLEEIKEDVTLGTELDKEDAGRDSDVHIVDIDGNEDTYGEGDIWQDSE